MQEQSKQGKFVATKAAGVFKRTTENGEVVFYITYKHNGTKHTEKMGTWSEGIREAYCKTIRAERVSMLRHGELPPSAQAKRRQHKITFGELAAAYFAEAAGRRSINTAKSVYANSLLRFAPTPAGALEKEDIERLLKLKEGEGKAAETLNHILRICRTIYKHALATGIYKGGNPTDGIKKRKTNNARQGFLAPDECKQLVEAVRAKGDKDLLLFVLLAITTGARVSTILSIRGIDCDTRNGVLRLHNLKTDHGYTAPVADELRSLIEAKAAALPTAYHHIIGGGEKPQNYRTPSKKLKPFLDTLFNTPKGISARDAKARIVTHSLRHSFGSNLAMAGVSPLVIMRMLDHSSLTLTERYAKIAETSKREAVNQLYSGIQGEGAK
ncbi:integrase [Campylobacterota bacterium]|nr:integrase [Campylobacterota bacterium]